jgi:hypothetical protein
MIGLKRCIQMGKRRSVAVIANEVLVLDGGVLRRALLRRKNGGEARDRGLFSRLRRVGAVAAGEERLGRQ